MSEPLISIVVAVKNSERTIDKCLNSIANNDYSNYETIVVNDASSDRTQASLEKYGGKIKIISLSESVGPSEARNLAARQARGEYLAFTDADCIVESNWLKELLKGFSGFPEAVACGGNQDIPVDASAFERKAFIFMQKAGLLSDYVKKAEEAKIILTKHNPSCNVMYKKDVFLREGGFLDGLWPGEDVELDYRLRLKGYRLIYNPKAVVYHYKPDNLAKFSRMMYRYGLVQGFLVRKYGIFRRVQVVPLVTVTFVLMILCLGFLNSWKIAVTFIILSIMGLLIYFALNLSLLILGIIGVMAWHIGYFSGIIKKSFKK